MSGVFIKGLKMPITCDDCIVPLSKCDFLMKRADACPLVAVPDHGDLIDRDALEKDFIDLSEDEWNKKTGTSWARAFEEAADVVYNAPTVIEEDWSE